MVTIRISSQYNTLRRGWRQPVGGTSPFRSVNIRHRHVECTLNSDLFSTLFLSRSLLCCTTSHRACYPGHSAHILLASPRYATTIPAMTSEFSLDTTLTPISSASSIFYSRTLVHTSTGHSPRLITIRHRVSYEGRQ